MKVFLHYSWDSEPHKEWVLKLANRLVSDGVDLFFDRYDLQPGSNNLHFMEQVEHAQKVVLIMSEGYKTKVENRKGGIGYEFQLITSELSKALTNNCKFIPVISGRDSDKCIPMLFNSYLHINMSDETLFEIKYIELLRAIYEEPEIIKPRLGIKPSFIKIEKDTLQKTKDKIEDIFKLGWSKRKTKKVLGNAQVIAGLQEQFWNHGLEVYYNKHSNKVDGILAKEGQM